MTRLLIELTPTRRIETIGTIKYRVYTGRTNTGVQLEMLGLFRVSDPFKREEFERAVCAVDTHDPPVVILLSEHGLTKP
jgi:hypothetical protein